MRFIIVISIMLASCATIKKSDYKQVVIKQITSAYSMNDSLLQIWRSDKFGCKKQRLAFVDSLFKLDHLMNLPKKVFVILYGNPDEITEGGTFIYRHVMDCSIDNKPIKETNSLDIAVFFKNDRLIYFEKIFVD